VWSMCREDGKCLVTLLVLVMIVLILGYFAAEFFKPPEVVLDVSFLRNNLVDRSYEDLSEHSEENRGRPVSYRGRVARKQGSSVLKVHITPENIGFWDELVHLDLMGSAKEVSVSEGDLIEFVGVTNGTLSGFWIFGTAMPRIAVYELVVVN
jgi:hypothetical protein